MQSISGHSQRVDEWSQKGNLEICFFKKLKNTHKMHFLIKPQLIYPNKNPISFWVFFFYNWQTKFLNDRRNFATFFSILLSASHTIIPCVSGIWLQWYGLRLKTIFFVSQSKNLLSSNVVKSEPKIIILHLFLSLSQNPW